MVDGLQYPLTNALDIYRNNYRGNLQDALAAAYPVVEQIVGAEFFSMLARNFIEHHPSRSGNLHNYGAELAPFLATFPPAQSLPYLADVARLEHARSRACHAADAPVLTAEAAAPALASGPRSGELRLVCHPSCCLFGSSHAVVSLWAAHQVAGEPSLAAIDLWQPEAALVLRPGLDVHVLPLTPGVAAFVAALLQQARLAQAAALATAADPGFDLAAALCLLMAQGALTAITLPASAPAFASPTILRKRPAP